MPSKRTNKLVVSLFVLAVAGCAGQQAEPGGKAGGGAAGLKERAAAMGQLKNIGYAYAMAVASGRPPKNLDELKEWSESNQAIFKAARDQQPFEIVWNVDPGKLATPTTETLLAWEKTADEKGGRCVLMADCSTVVRLSKDAFDSAPRAKGK